jgi:hypothetical protein
LGCPANMSILDYLYNIEARNCSYFDLSQLA